jgi:hypothetical protein
MAVDLSSLLSPQSNIRSAASNAQQRIALLRARGFNAEADVFEQGLVNKIQNKDATIAKDFEEIAKFYGSNIKGEGATRPKDTTAEDAAKKEAFTAATIAELNQLAQKSAESGNKFDQSLVQTITALAQVDPDKARDIAKSSFPVLEVKEEDKAPKKTQADVTFEQNAAAALRFTNQLSDAIKKYGTFEIASPEGSAQLGQLPYQMAIAYAKTVDPSSVAREGEVSAAQKYLIPIGLGTRNETALKAAESFKKDIEERVRQYKKSTGADISIEGVDNTSTDQEDKEPTVSGANSYFNQFKQQPAR